MQNNQDEVRGLLYEQMISQYLILEAIKNGSIWETQIPVSDRVHHWVRTIAYLTPSCQVKTMIKELFRLISIYSANA